MTFKCHPTSARPSNFRRIQQNCTEIFSAEFCGIPEKNWNDISVHFHRTATLCENLRKKNLYTEMCGIVWKSVKKNNSVRKCAEIRSGGDLV